MNYSKLALVYAIIQLSLKTAFAEEVINERLVQQTQIVTLPSQAMLYLNGEKVGPSPQVIALEHRLDKKHVISAVPLLAYQFRQDVYISKGVAPAQLTIFMDIDARNETEKEKDGSEELMVANTSFCETYSVPLPQIHFETNVSTLTTEQAKALRNWACVLQNAQPDAHLRIYGQADHRGSIASNFNLASKRAASVKSELVKAGILATHIKVFIFGETQLKDVAQNNTQPYENRRIIIEVLGTD